MNKSKVCGIILSDGSIIKMWSEEHGRLSDIFISDDTPTDQLSPDVITYYAEIQCGFSFDGDLCRIWIEPLGEISEPTEEPLEPSMDTEKMAEYRSTILNWRPSLSADEIDKELGW